MTSVEYLTDGAPGALAAELGGWLGASPRFAAFADAHRDKIRRKLRSATDADARLDVMMELRVAHRLLGDRRIELAFEAAGSTPGGPDFAVTFRDHLAFNLEVTRLHAAATPASVGRVIVAKLRQLPPSAANVLLIGVEGEVDLAAVAADLRRRADARDAELLGRGGFATPRDFYQRFLRLGAVIGWGAAGTTMWRNPSARIAVDDRALRACSAALGKP